MKTEISYEFLFKIEAGDQEAMKELRVLLYKGHEKHWSDCATNCMSSPELLGPCDCGGYHEEEP